MQVTGFSPGKVIISGEHSAGVGELALVSALSLGVEVTLSEKSLGQSALPAAFRHNLNQVFKEKTGHNPEWLFSSMRAELPLGSGLGSSAALAQAFFKAAAKYFSVTLSADELFRLVQQNEIFAHGEPSGIDAGAVVRGGLLEFWKREGQIHFRPVQAPAFSALEFVLIHTGRPQETTKEMITVVRSRYQAEVQIRNLMKTIGQLTQEIIQAVESDAFDPEMLRVNQRYLEEMGIVGEKARQMVGRIEEVGGVAKVTGAGGLTGGSGMLLAFDPDLDRLTNLCQTQAWPFYVVQLGVTP